MNKYTNKMKFKRSCCVIQVLIFFIAISIGNGQKLETNISVHDPVMIKSGDKYYLFSTGMGISIWSSSDMNNWKSEKQVFESAPKWTLEAVPGFRNHMWAPDIYFKDGQYYLYYAISAFGKNTSCIGLVTNYTLDPKDPKYKWTDKGKVLQSVPGRDMWNAIDPNLIMDEKGTPWLAFGSFWNGMKLVKLKSDLFTVAQPEEWYTIAARKREFTIPDTSAGDAAIEAPFIFKKGKFYYLFVSFDYCCRGDQSTYKMVVGRSQNVRGPYVDKSGIIMSQGGGSLLLEGDKNWNGVGHNSVYSFNGNDYLVFHAYDANDFGKPKLRVEALQWDELGWPKVSGSKFENGQ
jgi:arabinan endo-1,5-alpha-L-arabinosidase